MHLPRTGGSSLGLALKRRYRDQAMKVTGVALADVAGSAPNDARVFYGHMRFGLHRLMPVRYVTVLRDPVQRATSHFRLYMYKFGKEGRETSFQGFLEKWGASDVQTRILSGTPDVTADLGLAQEHLLTFSAVGFYDELERFAECLGLATPLPRLDKVDVNYAFSPEQLDQLQELNTVDAALYAWARKFAPQVAVAGQLA